MNNEINIEKIRKEKPIKELINFSIINIDKPRNPTSFKVDLHIKKALSVSKTSHFGTLDPKVTGILPVSTGRACRLLDFFMHKEKTYVGIMKLHKEVEEKKLNEVIKRFIGKIKQKPPVRSKVKREERIREVHNFDIIEFGIDKRYVLFKTKVQAGTYIRKLIHDMGEEKELEGAHMAELRRVEAGIFDEEFNLINLYQFDEAIKKWKEENDEEALRKILIPAEIVSEVLPIVRIKKDPLKYLLTGKILVNKHLSKNNNYNFVKGEVFCVFTDEDRFVGIYEAQSLESAKAKFVYN